MSFGLPDTPAPLPPAVIKAIAESTQVFKQRFGALAIMAESNGWIREYAKELERIARLAREAK